MKKKVISALLASTMIVSLVACGSTGGDSSDASSKGSGTTATSTAGGDDAATAESGSGSGDSAASADWIESSTLEDDAVPGKNDDRAFEKFDHVVEVHYGYQIDPKDTTLPDGDSVDNNQYTRYLLDNYNIKVVNPGTSTVEKAKLTLKVGNTETAYGTAFDPNTYSYTLAGNTNGDSEDNVRNNQIEVSYSNGGEKSDPNNSAVKTQNA